MPFESPCFLLGTLQANVDLSAESNQFLPARVVAANGVGVTGPSAIDKPATSGDPFIGILQNNPELAEAASVMVLGVSQATIVGDVAVGALLQSTPVGLATAGTGDYAGAIALEAGSDGDLISVLLLPQGIQA